MPEMVAHVLEGQPRLDQMSSARVPQAMGTAACPWPVCGRHPRGHDVIECPRGERSKGRMHRQEEDRLIARRPCITDIAQLPRFSGPDRLYSST